MGVDLGQFSLDLDDALAELAAVAFELRLTGAAQADAADTLTRKVGPETGQSWQPVFELGQLNLQATLMCRRPAGEDIQDQGRAVNDLDVETPLQVALLGGREIAVDHDDVVAKILLTRLDLFQLALADVCAGQGVGELLGHRADNLDVDRLCQSGQLLERVGGLPGLPGLFDGDEQGVLDGTVGG